MGKWWCGGRHGASSFGSVGWSDCKLSPALGNIRGPGSVESERRDTFKSPQRGMSLWFLSELCSTLYRLLGRIQTAVLPGYREDMSVIEAYPRLAIAMFESSCWRAACGGVTTQVWGSSYGVLGKIRGGAALICTMISYDTLLVRY